jgi:hypothetical protein
MATSPARNETHAQADEDSSRAPTPRPQPQPAAKTPSREGQAKAKRRSLPSAFKSQQPSPATSEQQQQAKHQPQQQTVPISNNDQDTTDDDNTAAAAATPAPAAVCETIPDWVDHYQALGYPHATVIEGLKRTTMVPGGLAAHVMESLRAGNGVPSHHEGVWTDRDDGDLRLLQQAGWPEHDLTGEPPTELAERKAFKAARRRLPRLENKHGVDRMRLRVKFLEAQDKLTTGT